MSKRQRVSQKKIPTSDVAVVPCMPEDLWRHICSYLDWRDIATLLNFVVVSESAIRFILPTIMQLVAKLRNPVTPEEVKWVASIKRPIYHHIQVTLVRCLAYYDLTARVTLDEWRVWASTILSTLRLSELHTRYCEKTVPSKNDRYGEGKMDQLDLVDHGPAPSTKLANIFYHTKESLDALPIYQLGEVYAVEDMPEKTDELYKAAKKEIKASRNECDQEAYFSMLERATQNHRRAACFYALANVLVIRKATPLDCYKNVVLKRPGDIYTHIYSQHNKRVSDFRSRCLIYKGPRKDARLALQLYADFSGNLHKCQERMQGIMDKKKK